MLGTGNGATLGTPMRVGPLALDPFARSPEYLEFFEVLRAHEGGDDRPIGAWIRKVLGRDPDERLLAVLDAHYLGPDQELPMYVAFRLLQHHGRRLEHGDPSEWHSWLAGRVYRRLYKHPGWKLMRSLKGYPQSPWQKLWEELPDAVALAEMDGEFGGYYGDPRDPYNRFMLGAVDGLISGANRQLRHTRRQAEDGQDTIFSPGSLAEVLDDPGALDDYAGVEDAMDAVARLDDLLARADLPDALQEIVGLHRERLTPQEIADRRGTSRGTVDKQFKDIRRRLAAVA